MLDALLAEIGRREREVTSRPRHPAGTVPDGLDLVAFTRAKVEPMVRGLFPRKGQGAVLMLLDGSVVFLTSETIQTIVRQASSLRDSWRLASMYLSSIGAEPVGEEERYLVGYSVDTTCYVSLEYFAEEDRFADFIVHEAAHVFHNTKRETIGLPHTRTREWLLPIDFGKRETFAYACEAYSRILVLAKRPADRRALFAELADSTLPLDERVLAEEYLDILGEAVEPRNGWRVILERCSVPRRSRGLRT